MGFAEIVNDVKAHFEAGKELLESKLPELAALASKVEADPLVQAAISLEVPAGTRAMLATLLKSVEADVKQIETDATAEAAAAAATPPADPPADPEAPAA